MIEKKVDIKLFYSYVKIALNFFKLFKKAHIGKILSEILICASEKIRFKSSYFDGSSQGQFQLKLLYCEESSLWESSIEIFILQWNPFLGKFT